MLKEFFRYAGILALLIVLTPILWYASGVAYSFWHTYDHRYRLTVEIDTPQGVRSGSGVFKVVCWRAAPWLHVALRQAGCVARGDAVFIDLGEGKNLIATTRFDPQKYQPSEESKYRLKYSYDFVYLAMNAFRGKRALSKERRWYEDVRKWSGTTELPDDLVPLLVTFSDLADPETVRTVPTGRIGETFGQGYAFKRASITMSREPVTRGIEEKLPWLPHPGYLSGKNGCWTKDEPCLHGGDFSMGRRPIPD